MNSKSADEVREDVSRVIRNLAAEQGHVVGTIPPTCAIGRDLGMSSIDLIHVLVELESYYNIPLSLADLPISADLAMSDLADYVFARLNAPVDDSLAGDTQRS